MALHTVLSDIDADDECLDVLFQTWFLDDVVLAGKKASVLQALPILEEYGPSLGIFVNLSKCELFCHYDHLDAIPATALCGHTFLWTKSIPTEILKKVVMP